MAHYNQLRVYAHVVLAIVILCALSLSPPIAAAYADNAKPMRLLP